MDERRRPSEGPPLISGGGDDCDVAQLGDLMDVANVASPLVASYSHAPAASAKIAALDGLTDVLAALGRVNGPVEAIRSVLELEGAGIAANGHARVIHRGDEIVKAGGVQRARFDHFTPAAHVALSVP
jgi:hypothetical protein